MYTPDAIEKYIDDSRKRMDIDKIDLVLLHCPPTPVYKKKEIFDKLEELKQKGKIATMELLLKK